MTVIQSVNNEAIRTSKISDMKQRYNSSDIIELCPISLSTKNAPPADIRRSCILLGACFLQTTRVHH